MSKDMTEDEIYAAARKRVEEKRSFYMHLTAYVTVNILLVIIWAFLAGRGTPWFLFVLGGWGIGIAFHFMDVFVLSKYDHRNRSAVDKEAERIKKELGRTNQE